jgi:hypothetical protein
MGYKWFELDDEDMNCIKFFDKFDYEVLLEVLDSEQITH